MQKQNIVAKEKNEKKKTKQNQTKPNKTEKSKRELKKTTINLILNVNEIRRC